MLQPLVLASESPYRHALLSKLGLTFSAISPSIDESRLATETVREMVQRLSLAKAQAVAKQRPAALIIASDQAAECNGVILGKPLTRAKAIEQLQQQSDKEVCFYTSVCVFCPTTEQVLLDLDLHYVKFLSLSISMIERYLDKETPYHCAGSFKSEGLGISLFEYIRGDDPNALIGLPLIKVVSMLRQFGWQIP